ncbi:CaiB/BaiF CoA transferase family protein [Brevibacillus borstelensis]|jgi:succinate---hydroxymethylglutarate CoA-transferase|uniref:CaiB/BaiF CoA transferase family protein n=1 Tax=Brevibacillus borstelensis TaxID=45462 RepID=UPI0004F28CCB|nr:CoA transferase [Brevibacillus borstelensis]KKX54148.1 acyl-CoA transferase [Brevibacillus borstelensis cifa_chp40]MED1854173.1 CoA transferase [Brevibacillus borstelensis]MED1882813.1 CoA transferase [Brevibacillus borstelensis]RNB60113.1 CoA transferase [Brevibacillus borstelensis]WNF07770.1 CoA transferase [Brevibacillus borstelensis]
MLTGITVVDFSRHLPGPFCTMRLADLGAEVIKVETHPSGDPGRAMGPRIGEARAIFLSTNRNKQSVALNLRTGKGKELAYELARQADVVVESFRPGVMKLLGLDYERLSKSHPSIIYCSLTGYGQSGPMHQLGGHDLNFQAASGLLAAIRGEDGKPVAAEVPIADYAGGMYASEQICAALIRRYQTGQGAYLDISLVDALSSWMGMHVLCAQHAREEEMARFFKGRLAYQIFETAEGKYVVLAALEEKFWLNFCRAVGREDWEDLYGAGLDEHPHVYEEMKKLFLSRTQPEWGELGSEVDCCLTPVEEIDTWLDSAFIKNRQLTFTLEAGEYGERLQVRTRASLSDRDEPVRDLSPPPGYGANTRQVLTQKLGLSLEELAQLGRDGVIFV